MQAGHRVLNNNIENDYDNCNNKNDDDNNNNDKNENNNNIYSALH